MATAMKNGAMVSSILDEAMIKDKKWELQFFYASRGGLPGAHEKHPWEPLPPQRRRTDYPLAPLKVPAEPPIPDWRPETGASRRSRMSNCSSRLSSASQLLCSICGGPCAKLPEHFPNLMATDPGEGRPVTGLQRASASAPALPTVPKAPQEVTRRVQHRRNKNGGLYRDAPAWKQDLPRR
mmetsp:Transcript_41519/g.115441  ORF Transcript_41519/g.115441 Transcript_41519/m.115441 type:complete len:181 (-) Transcript_41519:167-709(-)